MPAPRRLFPDSTEPSPVLKLFSAPDGPPAHRTTYPGRSDQDAILPRSTPNLAAIYSTIRDEHKQDGPEPIDPATVAAEWPLGRLYEESLSPWRRRQWERGEVARGTLEKERQSIRDFSEWDCHQQPAHWPAGHIWRGLPCGFLAAHYFEQWAKDRLRAGLAAGTVRSRWCQIRTVLNCARRLGVVQIAPPNLAGVIATEEQAAVDRGEIDEDDFVPTTYTDDQLSAVYQALSGRFDLQTAWVLGANCGPRSGDLFGLRWSINVKLHSEVPELFYKATKTGKRHWVPLAPCVVSHLRFLAKSQSHLDPSAPEGLVFPRLTSGNCRDPEKSRAARERNAILKAALDSVGLAVQQVPDYAKPWQVLRATCNSRLNNHRSGKGLLVTHGKDTSVSSQHYWNERPALIEAVQSLVQPAVFNRLLE